MLYRRPDQDGLVGYLIIPFQLPLSVLEASLDSYLVIDLLPCDRSHIALSRGLDQAWSNMGATSHERNLKGGFDAERGKGLASKGMFSHLSNI